MVSIAVVMFFTRLVMRPLENFEAAIERISRGERNVTIPQASHAELTSLVNNFNIMAHNLDTQIEELVQSELKIKESETKYRNLSKTLQQRVNQATEELKESNLQLEKALQTSEDASRAKSNFLANMSHELRTPLNAIIGYTEMIRDEAKSSGNDEWDFDLDKVLKSARHLLNLINDILDLSKIEAGKMEVYIEPIELNAAINQAIDTVAPLIEGNGNQILFANSPAPVVINSDATKLSQSIINLLSNASKFTHNGQISLQLIPREQFIDIAIKDTGIGMTKEQLEKLFRKFTQADASTTRKFGGTGLGLTITQYFCQMLGGDITVESEQGHGSTFTIHIPKNFPIDHLISQKIIAGFDSACPDELIENYNLLKAS